MADLAVTMPQWLAGYKMGYREAIGKGMTEAQARKHGSLTGDAMIKKVNNWVLPQDRPSYAHSAFGELFYQFQSQPANLFSTHWANLQKTGAGAMTKTELLWRYMIGMGIQGALIGEIRSGGNASLQDPKNWLNFATQQALGGMAFFGALSGMGRLNPIPALQPVKSVTDAITRITKEDEDKEFSERVGETLADAAKIYITFKVPGAAQLYRTLDGLADMANGETEDIRRLVWSKYQLGKEEEE
jgi:hypothetical protein